MKRKIIVVAMLVMCLLCSCEKKKEYTGEIDVTSSRSTISNDGYREDITVVVDVEKIVDYKDCAWTIIDSYIANGFKSTKFSFDLKGYPNELSANVYVIENDDPIFRMNYVADSYQYNIKDNPNMYTLEIEKIR